MQKSPLAATIKIFLVSIPVGTITFVALDDVESSMAERWLTLGACIAVTAVLVAGLFCCWLWLLRRQRIDKRQPMLLGRERVFGDNSGIERFGADKGLDEEGSRTDPGSEESRESR